MAYFDGKVAIVTGGSRGFGRILAQTFAAEGASVVLAARGAEALNEVAEEMRRDGRTVHAVPTDVLDDAQVDRLVAEAVDRFGRLDLLANCAGQSARGRVLDTAPAEFQRLWELNFLATVRCTRAAAPRLLASRGHLILVGSLASRVAPRYLGGYPASKFPLAAYAQQLRLELGPDGLHVLLVCPGPIGRPDAGNRYAQQVTDLPAAAQLPGGGARVRALDPHRLAADVLRACRRRSAEIVRPRKARLLFALTQLAPTWGDWLLKRKT